MGVAGCCTPRERGRTARIGAPCFAMRAPLLAEDSRWTAAGPDGPLGFAGRRSAGGRAESGAVRTDGTSLGGMTATLRAARLTGDVVRLPASGFPAGRVSVGAGERRIGAAVIVP
jgi:hypothetical protein